MHRRDSFTKTFLQKGLKIISKNYHYTIMLDLKFMLLSLGQDLFVQEKNNEIYMFIVFSSEYSKIVSVLLNKPITFYVESTIK